MKILKDKNHRASYYYEQYCEQNVKIFFNRLLKLNNMLLFNLKRNKIRRYGNIYNFEIVDLQQKIIKNEKKLNNIIDNIREKNTIMQNEAMLLNNNIFYDKSSSEKDIDKENDNNIIKKNTNPNFFLTLKSTTPFYKKVTGNILINLKKNKGEGMKVLSISDFLYNNNIINNNLQKMNKNKSFNLQAKEKDDKKDLTSYIKVFDEKENMQKQESMEELRAKDGLLRLAKAENNQIQKLKNQYKTCQNFFKMKIGENRSFATPFNSLVNNRSDNNRKSDEKELIRNYSNDNCIIDLYQRNVFSKKRMIMTSLYKNKFSEYFDKKLTPVDFNYDTRKTFLTNKKIFEYSFFDKKKIIHKSKSLLPKKKKYTNISNNNKLKLVKNFRFKGK
jgi:hypothetical protein